MSTTPAREHIKFTEAFNYFNAALFDGRLLDCMITLTRKAGARGYYAHENWRERTGEGRTSEIALNPDTFSDRDDASILSTLVHEMAHLWQFVYGEPSTGGYHNKSWGACMRSIGLIPSSTGAPGGKATGTKVSHYVEVGGRFDVACRALLAEGFTIDWQTGGGDPLRRAAKRASKTKYTCPECEANAWAKPGVHLICGDCSMSMRPEDTGDEDGNEDN